MECECGRRLIWRCDNFEKNISKYKCVGCGKIVIKPLKQDKVVQNNIKKEIHNKLGENALLINGHRANPTHKTKMIKNYHQRSSGKYVITKRFHYKTVYFGEVDTENQAKWLVKQLIKNNWDKKSVPLLKYKMIKENIQ